MYIPKERFYSQMLRIRLAEEKLVELSKAGEISSLTHLSIGQEAVAVGICSALSKDDSVVSTHRCHAHYLAKGGDLKSMMAELFGKRDGCCGGRGGSMHLLDPGAGMNLSTPIVGGSIPIAVGLGLSIKLKSEKRVSVAFFGDGAVEEGVFWESLNFASVHKLPVIFVCENNLYATHAHILKRQPSVDIAGRIASHNVCTRVVNGNNVLAVFSVADRLIKILREENQPVFIEAKTYRLKEHWGPGEDWHLGYRSRDEGRYWEARCPIKRLEKELKENGYPAGYFENLRIRIAKEIEEAVKFSRQSPEPSVDELLGLKEGAWRGK